MSITGYNVLAILVSKCHENNSAQNFHTNLIPRIVINISTKMAQAIYEGQ